MAGGGPAAGAAQGQAAAGAGQQLVQLQQLVAAEAGWVRGGEAGPGHRALRRHDELASADIPAQGKQLGDTYHLSSLISRYSLCFKKLKRLPGSN